MMLPKQRGEPIRMTITERLSLLIEHLGHEVSWEASPIQMGMDSMDYVEWGMLIEQEFRIALTVEEMTDLKDKPLREWVDFISNMREAMAR